MSIINREKKQIRKKEREYGKIIRDRLKRNSIIIIGICLCENSRVKIFFRLGISLFSGLLKVIMIRKFKGLLSSYILSFRGLQKSS